MRPYMVKIVRGDHESLQYADILAEAMIDACDASEEHDVSYVVVFRLVTAKRRSYYEHVRTIIRGVVSQPLTKLHTL